MNHPQEAEPTLVEVGRYAKRRQAEERGLVISAMGLPWWLERDVGDFLLMADERDRASIITELGKFELESAGRDRARPVINDEKIPTVSLFACGWVMAAFFIAQKIGPSWWVDAGAASSEAIVRNGEYWRALTALTLHAEFSHFAANLAVLLLFGAFVLRLLGSGWTWMLILASGGIGNLINAWLYRDIPHVSIGASTAVFGALGILTAFQTLDAVRSTRPVRLWVLISPLGAGLALLAYLGTGDERTDLLAHLWGFLTGGFFGLAASLLQVKKRTSVLLQRLLLCATAGSVAAAWLCAIEFEH